MKRRCMRTVSALLLIIMTAMALQVSAAAEVRELTLCTDVNEKYNANKSFIDETKVSEINGERLEEKVYEDGLGFVLSDKEKPRGKNVGVLDKEGNVVIPFEYSNLYGIIDKKYIIAGKEDENGMTIYGLIDYKGNTVIEFGKYSSLRKLNDSLMIAAEGKSGFVGQQRYGVIDAAEKVIVPIEYGNIWNVNSKYMNVSKDLKNGVMEHNGKIVFPTESKTSISHLYDDVFAGAAGGAEASGFVINSKGEKLFENIRGARVVADGLMVVTDAERKNTYYDFKGNVVDTKGFDIKSRGKDYYIVEKDNKQGVTDLNFNVLIGLEYRFVSPYGDNVLCLVNDNPDGSEIRKYVDKNGNEVDRNSAVQEWHDGIYRRVADNSFVDADGNLVLYTKNGKLKYCKEGLYLFDANGRGAAAVEYGNGKKLRYYIKGIKLTINSTTASVYGKTVECDVAPVIRDGRTMLPARFIAENLGATVEWNEETQSVIIRIPGGFADVPHLELTINSRQYKSIGAKFEMDAAPFVENGRTYVPVRILAENLSADVQWDESTQTVYIYK